MLLHVSGSSAVGKSTLVDRLAGEVESLACHDSDERIDEPLDHWDQRLDYWIDRALEYDKDGRDMLLATQRPFGEVLARPRAPDLSAIAGCVLDCRDVVLVERIRARSAPRNHRPGMSIVIWAAWHRMHAADPQWCQGAITGSEGRWERWTSWTKGDPRWRVPVFDTTEAPIERTVDLLAGWIDAMRVNPPLVREQRWWMDRGEA